MLLSLTGAAAILPLSFAPASQPEPAALRILSEHTIHPVLLAAMDVRWAGDRSVFLAAGRAGTFELPLEREARPRVVIPGSVADGGFWLSSRVAASPRFLFIAASAFSMRWKDLSQGAQQEVPFDAVLDIDLRGDRALILGALKDEKERFAPDGAIAWTGSLERKLSDRKPVYYSVSGPGARTINNCGPYDMGAVRFLSDGSFLIVPGVEPGAYLYDPSGRLVRTWDTREIGLDAEDCENLDPKVRDRLFAVPEPRWAWLNRRRILDDILPLPQGPGLIVRSVSQGRPRWELKVLDRSGEITTYSIPLTSRTDLAHLKGDVRGGRIVLLHNEFGRDAPSAPPRLFLAELPR